jgi:hypothetical protein
LQQLEELRLEGHACAAATSLQGLAGLSKLELLTIKSFGFEKCGLRVLQGISPAVTAMCIEGAPDLVSLAGMESCTGMIDLSFYVCGVCSLQPLRGLTSLHALAVYRCSLTSLKGLHSMSLQALLVNDCSFLSQLSGVEHLSALKCLVLEHCGCVTSLQPLSQLGEGLEELVVKECRAVQEEVLELPNVQPTAHVVVEYSNVREVVLAGGVRRAVGALNCS